MAVPILPWITLRRFGKHKNPCSPTQLLAELHFPRLKTCFSFGNSEGGPSIWPYCSPNWLLLNPSVEWLDQNLCDFPLRFPLVSTPWFDRKHHLLRQKKTKEEMPKKHPEHLLKVSKIISYSHKRVSCNHGVCGPSLYRFQTVSVAYDVLISVLHKRQQYKLSCMKVLLCLCKSSLPDQKSYNF